MNSQNSYCNKMSPIITVLCCFGDKWICNTSMGVNYTGDRGGAETCVYHCKHKYIILCIEKLVLIMDAKQCVSKFQKSAPFPWVCAWMSNKNPVKRFFCCYIIVIIVIPLQELLVIIFYVDCVKEEQTLVTFLGHCWCWKSTINPLLLNIWKKITSNNFLY